MQRSYQTDISTVNELYHTKRTIQRHTNDEWLTALLGTPILSPFLALKQQFFPPTPCYGRTPYWISPRQGPNSYCSFLHFHFHIYCHFVLPSLFFTIYQFLLLFILSSPVTLYALPVHSVTSPPIPLYPSSVPTHYAATHSSSVTELLTVIISFLP